MRFLELNEIAEWCVERGIPLEGWTRPAVDEKLSNSARAQFAAGKRSGRESAFAAAIVRAIGRWDECLLWVTLTGVWASGENWPAYYAMRGQHGEQRSLETATGHWFDHTEQGELIGYLTLVMENGWDAHLLPSVGGQAASTRGEISHDEWVELRSSSPIPLTVPAA